jgi:hypothetical protein
MKANWYDWFSGFMDGEGCFYIAFQTAKDLRVGCYSTINLTVEDKPLLFEIKKIFGGEAVRKTKNATDEWKEQWAWQISSLSDCLKLSRLLLDHPLRSRKKKDFALWYKALLIISAKRKRDNWGSWLDKEILALAKIRDSMNTKGKPNGRAYKNYNYIKNLLKTRTIEEVK